MQRKQQWATGERARSQSSSTTSTTPLRLTPCTLTNTKFWQRHRWPMRKGRQAEPTLPERLIGQGQACAARAHVVEVLGSKGQPLQRSRACTFQYNALRQESAVRVGRHGLRLHVLTPATHAELQKTCQVKACTVCSALPVYLQKTRQKNKLVSAGKLVAYPCNAAPVADAITTRLACRQSRRGENSALAPFDKVLKL